MSWRTRGYSAMHLRSEPRCCSENAPDGRWEHWLEDTIREAVGRFASSLREGTRLGGKCSGSLGEVITEPAPTGE